MAATSVGNIHWTCAQYGVGVETAPLARTHTRAGVDDNRKPVSCFPLSVH